MKQDAADVPPGPATHFRVVSDVHAVPNPDRARRLVHGKVALTVGFTIRHLHLQRAEQRIHGRAVSVQAHEHVLAFFARRDEPVDRRQHARRVFQYSVKYEDFMEWIQGWVHVAANYTLAEGSNSVPHVVESHVYEHTLSVNQSM